ncbi:MAG TPA: hypothetical protein VFW71_07520 [Actinomycetota bacterium]|nr:hypothetical protein [Actinomycetota bacterium]
MPFSLPFAARRGAGTALALLLVGLLLAACSSSKKPAASGSATSRTPPGKASAKPSPSSTAPPQANFSASGVKPVDAQDRSSANEAANAAAKQVINLMDTYYNDAFLQPAQWGGGTFPSLSGLFTQDAAGSVAANLPVLTLGGLANQISRVDPTKQSAGEVSVLIEPDGSASFATVTTRFEGTGKPSGGGPAVQILQSAQFMVQISGSTAQIAGYDITSSYAGVAGSASYNGPIGATA